MISTKCVLVAVFLNEFYTTVRSSAGDRSNIHQRCLSKCFEENCTLQEEPRSILVDPQYNWLIWDCKAECEYSCMWRTVTEFTKHRLRVPQFYGKWPFVRLFGIQEPASVFFSILNGLAHIYSIVRFRRYVVPLSPMFWTWHFYCLVAVNTWFWSSVFHTRDFDFTEKMDYFCATSLVTFQLYGLFRRVLVFQRKELSWIVALLVLLLCSYHIYNMAFVHFDYGYHIKVNVIIGVCNAIGWVIWCLYNRSDKPYVWKSCTSILLAGAFLALEVLDFPPLFWVFDAHSLWHAGTAPLTLLWYSFLIDDCNHLTKHGPHQKPSFAHLE